MVNLISIFTPHKTRYYEPIFTTRQIKFEKPELTLYLHGAPYGELCKKKIVYLSDVPFPETNPDTSKIFEYKGDYKIFLYYKVNNDTLSLFIPKGLADSPSSFNKNIVIKQYEYTANESKELRMLMSKGIINQYVWRLIYKQPVHNSKLPVKSGFSGSLIGN